MAFDYKPTEIPNYFHGDSNLTNSDLIPVPVENRTWTWWSFSALWMGMVHNVFNFTWIGGLMSVMGMSVWEALSVAIAGNIIMTILIGLNGRVGSRHGIPFAVWSRSAFGVFGANIPAVTRGFVAIGWFSVQSYLGSTAINVLFEVTIPYWKEVGSTSLLGAPTNLMIAMIIYWMINIFVVKKGMDAVRRFENWAGPMVFIVLAFLLVWVIKGAGGLGPILHTPSKFKNMNEFILVSFIPMIALYISGSWATMVLNISDITRFARSNKEQFWGTMIGMPLASFVFYFMSAVIVSCGAAIFGKTLWNPADILLEINNPILSICGAILLAIATISVNIPANIVSPAYDLANLLPRVFNFKRGAIFSIILSFMFMPWIFMKNPEAFYGIINNAGALIGPATGIIMADFFIIRKQKLDVLEMFKVNGAYRYVKGFSPIALGVLFLSTVTIFVGEFVPHVEWLYKYAWFVGLALGFVFYLAAVYGVIKLKGKIPPEYEERGTIGAENLDNK